MQFYLYVHFSGEELHQSLNGVFKYLEQMICSILKLMEDTIPPFLLVGFVSFF